MKLARVSHIHAEAILRQDFPEEFADLESVLGDIAVPLRPAAPFMEGRAGIPKRQRKRVRGRFAYVMLPVDQSSLNETIDAAFRGRGWERQPYAGGRPLGSPVDSRLRGDFVKNQVFVEVEFGNGASTYRDLFKFQIASRTLTGQVGVLVVATNRLARFFDSGVATFEQVLNLIPYMAIGVQMPVWVVGIEPETFEPIESRYSEMQATAEANGVACHPYADWFVSNLPEEPELELE